MVAHGEERGDGRQNADGDGNNEGTGHVENGLCHFKQTVQYGSSLLGGHFTAYHVAHVPVGGDQIHQTVHIQAGFDDGQQLQTRRADGDGHGNGQDGPGDLPGGAGIFLGPGQLAVGTAELTQHVHQRQGGADGNADDGAAGCHGNASGGTDDQKCQGKAHYQFADGLDHLGDGGGDHITLAVEVAAVSGHQTDEKSAGTQTGNGDPGIGLIHQICQPLGTYHHKHGGDGTQDGKDGQRGFEYLPQPVVVI